jgi:hypothetical protein
MQRRYFLPGGALLLAAVSSISATTVQAADSRPSSVAALEAKPVTVRPVLLAPGGLRLRLSTHMGDLAGPPRASAAVDRPGVAAPPAAFTAVAPTLPVPSRQNPYLPALAKVEPAPGLFAPIQVVPADKYQNEHQPGLGSLFGGLVSSIPLWPDSGPSILPSIKKVYPTGEKPLVVVSFKCPTEVLGVTPPTIKLLHNLVDLGMEAINKTELLSFNLQQVCQ